MSTRNTGSPNESRTTAASVRLSGAERQEAEQVTFLREANERLSRELSRIRGAQAELVQAVYRAAKDAASGLVIPRYQPPKLKARPGQAECAIPLLGDIQLGKVTPTYSSKVAEERVLYYADKIVELTNIQRSDHPVPTARVYMLGDMIEGELIFPHQPYLIDSSLGRQIVLDGPRILIAFLNRLLANFERVHVVAVIGNHGKIGEGRRSRYNPETNGDRMLYQILQQLMRAEKRLTWHIPYEANERAALAVDYPFGSPLEPLRQAVARRQVNPPTRPDRKHGFLLLHGDQIPGSASHSVGTVAKHIFGYASGAVDEPFEYVVYGHWHSPRYYRFNKFRVWGNGSTESTNTYAMEQLAAIGKPEQTLLFCHPDRGVSAEYQVQLT